MRIGLSIVAGSVAITLCGCASAGFHQVSFAAESSTEASDPVAHHTVHVVRNTQMTDTLLEMRIRSKLEEFLLEKGYVMTSPDTAELYVLATFGSGERMVASTAPVFRDAEVKVERNRDGTVISRKVSPDRVEYLRLPLVENSVWLQVLSSDARYYRQTGLIRNLWRGEAAMKGSPSTLASKAPYLLVPALKFFGKGTNEVVTVDVKDSEVPWR